MKIKKGLSIVVIFVMLFSMITTGFAASDTSYYAEENNLNLDEVKILKEPKNNPRIQLMNALRFVKDLKEQKYNSLYLENNKIRLVIQNDGKNITGDLVKAGAKVVQEITKGLYSVTIPINSAEKILNIKGIKNISLDKIYTLDPREKEGFNEIKAKLEEIRPNLFTTLDDTKADSFRNSKGVDGTGVTIAVLDTGVDPGHEMLQFTTNGDIKITDWQDMTTEGDILASEYSVVQAVYGEVYNQVYMPSLGLDTVTFTVPDDITVGEAVYMGTLYEGIFPNEILFGYEESATTGFDFNFNGEKTDTYPILVAPNDGNYDAVYVDTNLNGDFTDEDKLIPYVRGVKEENTRYVDKFLNRDNPNGTLNFVLTYAEKSTDGVHLNLGFDGGEHGTHVAGIAAGNSQLYEGFTGVAPGANIMAVKVLGSNVGGSMSHIINGMIYAAINGADIVNMSLGSAPDINDGSNLEAQYANFLTEEFGTVFCISAGNNGPGINTIGAPGDADLSITSGAYIEEDTWAYDYGDTVPGEGLWYFSSIGPREDGTIKPTIVTPGAALSSVPDWAGGYAVMQGTSMSSPHTAGLVALLTEASRNDEIVESDGRININILTEALKETGRKLDGYLTVEQGGGLVDVEEAYNYIAEKASADKYNISVNTNYNEKLSYSTGIYVRNNPVPRTIVVEVTNHESKPVTLNIEKQSNADWYRISAKSINIEPQKSARFTVMFKRNIEPGLYSDVVKIDSPDTELIDAELPITIATGQDLSSKDLYTTTVTGEVPTSKYDRNYINIPEGLDKLVVELKAIENPQGQLGRIRAIIFDPNGFETHDFIGYAGLGNSDPNEPLIYEISNPQPGNWEINMYTSTANGDLQIEKYETASQTAAYEAVVRFEGIVVNPDGIDAKIKQNKSQHQDMEITNLTGEDKNIIIEGTNLVDLVNLPEPEVIEYVFDEGDSYVLREIKITEDDPNFLFNIAIESLTNPEEDDFDLYLYDENFNEIAYDADGDADESISLSGLKPGLYYVIIENFAATEYPVTIKYTEQIVNISDADPEAYVEFDSTPTIVKAQETIKKRATVNVSDKITKYGGLILIKDADEGTILTQLPVNVEVIKASGGSSGRGSGGSSSGGKKDSDEPVGIVESTVGNDGGTVQDAEGNITLVFEEGTFEEKVEVQVSILDEEEINEPEESDKVVRVTDVYEFICDVNEFAKPVKVEFIYGESKLGGINEELLGVYRFNEETEKWEYVGGKVDKENNKVVVELNHFSKYTVMASTKTFNDMVNHWAEHEVKVAAAKGIINGVDGTNYAPERNMTRAEFVKILVSTLGLEEKDYSQTFIDTNNAWYTGHIEAALDAGLITANEKEFRPDDAITREEMATMVAAALKFKSPEKAVVTELTFEDKNQISEESLQAVAIAYNNGIIKGMTETTFAPKANATRAQAAVMIYRMLQVLDLL